MPVPFLFLQPLVENAVKHGLGSRRGPGECGSSAEDAGAEAAHQRGGRRARAWTPSGPGRCSATTRRGRGEGGIGLANVDARLRQIYGEDYGLVVESGLDAGTRVNLRVPKVHPSNSYL